MFGKSLAAQLVASLVTIGILPSGKYKALDWIKLIFWVIAVIFIIAFWHLFGIYFDYLNNQLMQFDGVESLMELVVPGIVPTLRMFGTVLALSTAWNRYPNLLIDDKIPAPSMPWFFTAVVLQFTIDSALYIWTQTTSNLDNGKIFPQLIGGIMYETFNIFSAFVVGVCVAQFKRKIQAKEDISDTVTANVCGEKTVREMQALKHFLSPLLFIIILTNYLDFILRSYWALYKFPSWVHITGISYMFLTIAYVSIIIQSVSKKSSRWLNVSIILARSHKATQAGESSGNITSSN